MVNLEPHTRWQPSWAEELTWLRLAVPSGVVLVEDEVHDGGLLFLDKTISGIKLAREAHPHADVGGQYSVDPPCAVEVCHVQKPTVAVSIQCLALVGGLQEHQRHLQHACVSPSSSGDPSGERFPVHGEPVPVQKLLL